MDEELELDDDPAPAPRRPRARPTPPGSAVPKSDRGAKLLTGFGKMGEPLAPGEARRALYHSHVALALALGSTTPLKETDFEVQGDSLADMSNHIFPGARLMLRGVTPLIFVGAELGILREIAQGIEEDAGARRLWSWVRGSKRSEEKKPLYVMPRAVGE